MQPSGFDLVAQTDHYKPNATRLADFVVEGENANVTYTSGAGVAAVSQPWVAPSISRRTCGGTEGHQFGEMSVAGLLVSRVTALPSGFIE
jgi:hypothetical protein